MHWEQSPLRECAVRTAPSSSDEPSEPFRSFRYSSPAWEIERRRFLAGRPLRSNDETSEQARTGER